MSYSLLDPTNIRTFQYIVTHVFCPLQLPDGDDHSVREDHSLATAVTTAAHLYNDHVDSVDALHWRSISRMLTNLQASVQFVALDESKTLDQLRSMKSGDVLAYLIRAQNAAVIFRKLQDVTVFESFEVSPMAEDVMTTQGKLICSYPGPAIEIPNARFENNHFLPELANFLVRMNVDILDAAATSRKAQSTLPEERDTTHPRYITELLTGILRSVGRPADIIRITKRVGDDVVWDNSKLPWRRSSLWLPIRVAIQTSLDRTNPGHADTYKQFMLFFMCRISNEELCMDLSNDHLQFMLAKISRRLRKLGSSAPEWLSRLVLQTCNSLRSTLERRWGEIQAAQRASPLWAPAQLDLARDVELSLLRSGDYLRRCLADDEAKPLTASFNPKHRHRGTLDDFLSSNGTFFDEAYCAEPHVALYDVEQAVERDIDGWVDRVTSNDEACVELETLGHKYSSSALKTYENKPELLSIMLLTTIELWVALDKIAIKEIPMLADYSPEVPTSLLENLLLSKASSLSRLRLIHQYLSRRHSQSRTGWSVFSSSVTTDSFSVRFYSTSSQLQCIKEEIEKEAWIGVHEKFAELERANARHAELTQQAARADHEFAIHPHGYEYHASYCRKCRLEKERSNMEIDVHEWPLPADRLHAEMVVFELCCPVSFDMWRTATFHLLVDLCSSSPEPEIPYIQLTEYAALRPYLVRHPRSRITLGSDTKPVVNTHYRESRIPAIREKVCVDNGLTYYGFDSRAVIPISNARGPFDIREHCTFNLQSGPYENLQKYVGSTSHTSNEVMANQADCHEHLSIHEYIAFGHLRSGGLLQWPNILRELRARSLNFRHQGVHLLIAQAISQVGPLIDAAWTWHQEIERPSFCYALLGELEMLIRDVEANWLEGVTMDTISFLLRRLLAATSDQAISAKALALLRTVRRKVFAWVKELLARLEERPEDEVFRGFLRDAVAVCRSTFDVDTSAIRELLHSSEDIDILLFSALLIHDHTPSKLSSLPAYSRILLDRDRRLSLTLESIVNDAIQADSSDEGIHLAVGRIWPDYRPGSKWTPLQNPNSRWFSCTTAPTDKQGSQTVHFNLLDGTLLFDGKPLGRLPNEILQHPLYNLIFGEQVLEVIPSDVPGMDYATRGTISGHQVYFSLGNDSDLVIRAKAAGDPDIIRLIPQEKLEGDLPAILIHGHAHWLNRTKSTMEIRPLENLWKASLDNWKMDCTPGRRRLQKGNDLLLDIRSQSWTMVSNLLLPFDCPENLIVSVPLVYSSQHMPSLQLSVVLPRYDLSFYVDEDGDFQSHDMRGMVYDENQYIGTLFGLVNRIVLRPKAREASGKAIIPRCILIPDGKISFEKDGHHVRVEVTTGGSALDKVAYQTYSVDTDLGRLTGNIGLANKLYCAYLHALTSGCGIDPLTGRSGTEEALSLLRSASYWSAMKFDRQEAELLGLIASICPARTWYPKHLERMQNVQWLDLPANSQHHELYVLSKGIKEHYERVLLFHETQSSDLFQSFPSHEEHLLERAALRLAYIFPSEFSGQPSGTNFDVQYPSRDLVQLSSAEGRTFAAATAVRHRNAGAASPKSILEIMESWKKNVSGNALLSLQYDKSWLAPELPLVWLKMYKLLRGTDEGKWFQLLFSLPAMAYAKPQLAELVPVLVAFASDSRFRSEDPPLYDTYDLSEGYQPSRGTLRGYVFDCAYSFGCSPESLEPAKHGETDNALTKRQLRMYNDRRDSDVDSTVHQLLTSWPRETPPQCSLSSESYDISALASKVQSHFSSCYRNLKLQEHLGRVQSILNDVHFRSTPFTTLQYSFQSSRCIAPRTSWSLSVDRLFVRPAPWLQAHDKLPLYTEDDQCTSLYSPAPLHRLVGMVEESTENTFQRRYASALRTSADCFENEISLTAHVAKLPTSEVLEARYAQCRASYMKCLGFVEQHLRPKSQSEQALEKAGQWPRITAYSLFQSLASNSSVMLSDDWKKCLIRLALHALELQRARRLLRLHSSNLDEELRRELQNEGCDGWDAEAHPDWLLIQLESNLFVRRVQADVAIEMISPCSGNNTAMQLNMGEGKSSVIVPIVVTVLADGTQLVRVIVPKALTAQMFDLLVGRLGGLANRRVYFLPFSRSLELDQRRVIALRDVTSECMKERGIMVVQPEHVLSLKLVSVEKQLNGTKETELACSLLRLQKWLHLHSRDILDESDEILHVRYQLVYTMGLQQHMEGFPERWTTTEQVLALVSKHAPSLKELFPLGVECERGPSGSFPHLRILHADAGERLISCIVQDIMKGLLPNFNFVQLHPGLRDAIRSFISCESIPPAQVQLVKDYYQNSPFWGGLLLLRGLLATGILLFAFRERRWRVDYGLLPGSAPRTTLAVPYRAKDVPAQRAEFGHPDIAIVLTCLSYYYRGLSKEQLVLSFEMLLKQDDPALDYDLWVRDCPAVPECLRTISGINIKSSEQWSELLFPLFKQNRATVDFYLSNVVFPKEAKEFPSKLSCSGWDLAEKKGRLLTGFSGTNDGQYLLPLHITQRDPDHQQGTNAKVLTYLLQPENSYYMCMTHMGGERRTTSEFLETLVSQRPEIRVLLDVGAQMLDLQNCELAKAWLALSTSTPAAIYFNKDDELTVLTRDGRSHLLKSSPFAQQLDQCVVYLDDAHTRGTDIKFPSGFRAAVTLGPKITKDRLAQGCMRMRKLGHGHSVMFFAPLEIDRRIRAVAHKGPLDVINTCDILQWTIRETCDDIQQRVPHWAQQGADHASRYAVWTSFCANKQSADELSGTWLQPEAKKLEDLYGPGRSSNPTLPALDILQRCIELGVSSFRDVSMDEEQEREVLHEAERERQVERPPRVPPVAHAIHPHVAGFIKTGIIPTCSEAFCRIFETLEVTSAATSEAHVWSPHILATMDFQQTVSPWDKMDDYLRPVMWVVSGKRANHETLVILSPYEANHLLPDIRSSSKVHLHLYTPRVIKSAKPCDDLDLYSIPAAPTGWTPRALLIDQLNAFAGQLYLKDYETYVRLCRFLCIYTEDLEDEEEIDVGCDGFIPPNHRPGGWSVYSFQTTPLASLKTLMGLRRKGMRFAPTHMGKILDGRLLTEDDFRDDNVKDDDC